MQPARFCSILAVFWLIVAGCADDPTAVGLSLLPPEDLPVFSVDTLYATGHQTAATTISTINEDFIVPTWAPTSLFIGSRQSLTALTYVRFTQFPDSMRGVTVTAADLVLYDKAWHGDSLGLSVGQIAVHRGRGFWRGDSLTADSLSLQAGAYFDPAPTPSGVGTGTVDSGATTIPLDTAMVREWFITTIDTGTTNRGMVLRASPGNSIRGFWSHFALTTALQPRLRVRYLKNGVPGTFEHRSGFSRYLASLSSGALVTDPSRLYVQTGVAYRGNLQFDVSALPMPVSVSAARLVLTLDRAASDIGPYSQDSLFVFAVTQNGSISPTVRGLGTPETEAGRTTYTFSTNGVVRTWLRDRAEPLLTVAGLSENSTLTRFAFYGPAASPDLRPRLVITYSRVNKTATAGGAR